jgi:hypothetical protein
MGRGRDKSISLDDIRSMSPQDGGGLANLVKMGRVKIKGTAVVRSAASGNARYEKPELAGTYNEDKL